MRAFRLLPAVAIGVLAVPASASAAGFVFTGPQCLPKGADAPLQLSGFTPDTFVTVSVEGEFLATIRTGSDGGFTGQINSAGEQTPDDGQVTLNYAATDDVSTATAQQTFSDVGFTTLPSPRSARTTLKVRAFGQIGKPAMYVHYARQRKGAKPKLVKTVKLANLAGPCGSGSATFRALPLKKPKPGIYEIQVDTRPNYDPTFASAGEYAITAVVVDKKH